MKSLVVKKTIIGGNAIYKFSNNIRNPIFNIFNIHFIELLIFFSSQPQRTPNSARSCEQREGEQSRRSVLTWCDFASWALAAQSEVPAWAFDQYNVEHRHGHIDSVGSLGGQRAIKAVNRDAFVVRLCPSLRKVRGD